MYVQHIPSLFTFQAVVEFHASSENAAMYPGAVAAGGGPGGGTP